MAKREKKINPSIRADEFSANIWKLERKIETVMESEGFKKSKLSQSDVHTLVNIYNRAVREVDYQTVPYPPVKVDFIQATLKKFLENAGFTVENCGIGYAVVF